MFAVLLRVSLLLLLLLLTLLLPGSLGVSRSDLFPFGTPAGDQRLPPDAEDISSREVKLGVDVQFFNKKYGSIYVSAQLLRVGQV